VSCQVCLSTLKAGDLYCSSCGSAVPEHVAKPQVAEVRGRIASERKYLTVLSADLQRSTDLISELDPEAAISRLEPALVAMRVAVRRNRGIVSKEGGDGLIAIFGAPRADDNHAAMACHAAVELVRRVKLLNDEALRVRVGVHSGYVVVHVIEDDLSSIYEAGGPAVHLVKRLESAAQAGQIVVSESCQSLAAGLVTFNALAPKRLQGFSAPVPCHEVVEISGLTRWRARSTKGLSAFVGRGEEISLLERAAQDVASSGQIIALVGTPGIGKSRIAHEFVAELRQKDWQILEAEGNPLEQAVPFAMVKKLLQSALQQMGRIDPADQPVPPEGPPPAHSDLWPAALCAVLDQPVSDLRWSDLEPLLRQRLITEAVCDAVGRAVSARPTVLLLEDLHWVDIQSKNFVEALMSLAASRRLLILLTWRTEDTPGWLARLDVRRIWLRSLDITSANALLGDLLGTAPNLNALKAHILRHTGQVPLFIEELARQLINRGVLKGDTNKFAVTAPWDALEIPPTVQGVIASRIDRLSNEDKALLQLASVVGPRISPALLSAVTGMPTAQLQSRLWSLEILDFLVESQWLGSREYAFAHDLIREVAYDSILRAQREELHRRILTAMEASSPGRKDVAEALCHHAVQAQDWVKAEYYAEIAAKKAFARSAFRDATEYFEVAMDAIDKQPASAARERRAIDLRIEARMAYVSLGNIERWFELGREGEARSEKVGDEGRRLASIAIRAAALNFHGTPYEGMAAGEQAVELANRLNNKTWLAFVEYGLGQSYFLAGKYREAQQWLGRGSARLASDPENVPPGNTASSLLVLCYMMRALVHAWLGEYDEAERCWRQAGDHAKENERPYDLIAAEYGRGLVQMMRGNLGEAENALEGALRASRDSEVRLFLPLVMLALGNLYTQQGHAARARDILLQAKDEAEAVGHVTSIVAGLAYLGVAYSQLGDVQRGLTLVQACQASAKQKGYAGIEALAVVAEANILASQGEPAAAEAFRSVHRAVEIAGRLEARPLLAAARGVEERLLAASGRKAEAQDELAQAMALFDQSK
jgi:class 3 adenylate cyclase/tetratricopeptide (TPR) repeat protein